MEGANTSSRIDVAEARKHGDVGEKTRQVETRKQQSVMEADAKQVETAQNQKMSDYARLLAVTVTTNKQQEDMAKIEAYKTTQSKQIEVESELNKQKQTQELEKLRSVSVVKATADAEAIIKMAQADGEAKKIAADAQFYAKSKEADAIRAVLEAQTQGLDKIYAVSSTNPQMASFYLALDKGVFNRDGLFSVLADKQAQAIYNLNPKINIWNTGAAASGNSYTDVISGLGKTIPPMLDAIQQQTGIKLPSWMVESAVEEIAKMNVPEAVVTKATPKQIAEAVNNDK